MSGTDSEGHFESSDILILKLKTDISRKLLAVLAIPPSILPSGSFLQSIFCFPSFVFSLSICQLSSVFQIKCNTLKKWLYGTLLRKLNQTEMFLLL